VSKCDNADFGTVLMVLLLQRRGQSHRAAGMLVCTSDTSGYNPLNPTTLPNTSMACSSAATLVTGRSPSLVAMERVMPKYSNWASSDAVDARGRLMRDRKNIVHGCRPTDAVMQPDASGVVSPCRNASVPVHQLPAITTTAAAAAAVAGTGSLGLMSGDVLSSSLSVNGSVRSAKEELRARLTHRPASNSALYNVSQLGGKDDARLNIFPFVLKDLVICELLLLFH